MLARTRCLRTNYGTICWFYQYQYNTLQLQWWLNRLTILVQANFDICSSLMMSLAPVKSGFMPDKNAKNVDCFSLLRFRRLGWAEDKTIPKLTVWHPCWQQLLRRSTAVLQVSSMLPCHSCLWQALRVGLVCNSQGLNDCWTHISLLLEAFHHLCTRAAGCYGLFCGLKLVCRTLRVR